jgi:hypothetical protein
VALREDGDRGTGVGGREGGKGDGVWVRSTAGTLETCGDIRERAQGGGVVTPGGRPR